MRIYNIPLLILGVGFMLIGLQAAFAPGPLVLTPNNFIAFETLGRIPPGLFMTGVGGLMTWEGVRGSQLFLGPFLGTIVSLFFCFTILLPIWFGPGAIPVGPFEIGGPINGLSAIAWATIATLCGYYYLALRNHI